MSLALTEEVSNDRGLRRLTADYPATAAGRIILEGALLYTSGMLRIPGLSRSWLIAGAIGLGVVLTTTILLGVVYPRVGAWMIRSRVGGKLAARTGRDVRFGAIDVGIGHAVMRNLEIRGPLDGDTP